MEKIYKKCLTATFFLMAFLLLMNGSRRKEEALAAQIAPEVLRFHVLANSNTAEDQVLKLALKDHLLEVLRPHVTSKKEAQDYIMQNKETLEEQSEQWVRSLGYAYPVTIQLETCDFPKRTYGDITFPAGTYDAVRVLIGEGAGKNFWCVLYPSLCNLDSVYSVKPGEYKKTEQDFSLPRLRVRFKLLDWIASL